MKLYGIKYIHKVTPVSHGDRLTTERHLLQISINFPTNLQIMSMFIKATILIILKLFYSMDYLINN